MVSTSVVAILVTIGKWLILDKFGEEGWKGLIPIYGEYLIFKHIWSTKVFWGSLVAFVACMASAVSVVITLHNADANMVALASFVVTAATCIYIDLKASYRLAKSFGHGIGYTLGLVFFKPVFYMVLGASQRECPVVA